MHAFCDKFKIYQNLKYYSANFTGHVWKGCLSYEIYVHSRLKSLYGVRKILGMQDYMESSKVAQSLINEISIVLTHFSLPSWKLYKSL